MPNKEPLTSGAFTSGIIPDGWKLATNAKKKQCIERILHAKSYMGGVHLVRDIAKMADKYNHHPDMRINYRRLTLQYTTHTTGGLTSQDMEMAKRINKIISDNEWKAFIKHT